MMYTECDISTCPCQEQCLNQRFHKHEWVSGLEVIVTKDRGYGIRTSDSISNGKYLALTLKSLISKKKRGVGGWVGGGDSVKLTEQRMV